MDERKDLSADYPDRNLDSMISTVDSFIRKQYLAQLQQAEVVPLSMKADCIKAGRNVRLFRIVSLSYCETDDLYGKIANIFGAVAEFDASQVLILDSDGYKISFYLGIACSDPDRLSMQFDAFKGSFLGNFPGGRISILNLSKNEELLGSIFGEENIRISAVSALATSKEISGDKIYGIERLVEGLYGKPFTMLMISDAVPKKELCMLRQNLEAMYTELSPFREYTLSVNRNASKGYTESLSLTKSASVSTGKSVTENTSFGTSKNKSSTVTQNREMEENKAKNQLVGTALSLAAILSGLGSGAAEKLNPLQGVFYGGSISSVLGSIQMLINGTDPGAAETTGEGESCSISFSEGETSSRQEGFSTSKGISDSRTEADGRTVQMHYENKSVMDLLGVIDEQIARTRHIEEIGGFRCAAYFVTGDNATALTAANMYRSLLGGENSLGQNNAVNVWSDPRKVADICEYLARFRHPLFHFERKPDYPTFTAGSLVAADEFSMYASLPRKSLSGLPVAVRAEFARDVIRTSDDASDKIEVGNIFHMGKVGVSKVFLSKNDLSGHMFVAGTTGMGKSNFCYGLLDSLRREHVRFMVIEPAKGEYRQVFGGCEGVHTFGTNPDITPLLRINPFSFPAGIHVNEHISRLLEIFNSCWPMYAAMPEVLKEGMETIYRQCGYNLITGRAKRKNQFPAFADLLKALPEIIRKSEFSSEVKGNYTGSLVTRVKSLTDGLYGCIFTEEETDSRILFDENVLIDLSRVGSGETKALIMGIMVMKLQEYRMCHARMNTPLSHVTVLEEAHHLLKAATASSAEGVNLRAMSLEMITNAIAEMRTYGEGFLIADQSPMLMDLSVIRNTNTKVVFKLPEHSDRMAVGAAMSLSESQIRELSRLERGVAAIYQSNWDNAVLSKIRYYDSGNFRPYVHYIPDSEVDDAEVCSQCLAAVLRGRLSNPGNSSWDMALCRKILAKAQYADRELQEFIAIIGRYAAEADYDIPFAELCRTVDRIIRTKELMGACGSTQMLDLWEARAKEYISSIVDLTEAELNELITLCINIRAGDSPAMKRLYFRYLAFARKNGGAGTEL